jgi:hypothetical protein
VSLIHETNKKSSSLGVFYVLVKVTIAYAFSTEKFSIVLSWSSVGMRKDFRMQSNKSHREE